MHELASLSPSVTLTDIEVDRFIEEKGKEKWGRERGHMIVDQKGI
jgi:hypothetical protein